MPAFPGIRRHSAAMESSPLQLLWIDPRIARGVLKRLAYYQAAAVDPLADAEPGKILHEMRGGEMAVCEKCRSRNIMAASMRRRCSCCSPVSMSNAPAMMRRSGVVAAIEAALRWIDGAGIPTRTASSNISAPPKWVLPIKAGRIPTTRSSMPTAGWRGYIALAEVQGYVFAAKQLAARCAPALAR